MEREPEIADEMCNLDDPNFDRKLDLITAGARPYVKKLLLTKITRENCQTIITYILAFMTEVNPAQKLSC